LVGDDKICHANQNTNSVSRNIYTWAAVPPEQREASSSSQHGDEDGCTLSLSCKFEINLKLFAI